MRRKPVAVNGTVAANIREDWRADYKDYGTVEGRLESIQDHEGTLKLQVRDALLRQTIPCYFPEEMLADAFRMFRKRVEVSGTIHYRRNGKAISIEVASIEKLPEGTELLRAVRLLERHLGRRMDAIGIAEIGGGNSIGPLVVGLQAGIPYLLAP